MASVTTLVGMGKSLTRNTNTKSFNNRFDDFDLLNEDSFLILCGFDVEHYSIGKSSITQML